MDLTQTIIPRSDQVNADDMISGPMTVTIKDVSAGSSEQPVNITLVETPGRAYKPSKSMRRVLVAAWGKEASDYVGRRLTLFRNPEITFGRDKVGGIEISHLSHLEKPMTVALTTTRGKRKAFTVQPLKEAQKTVQQPSQPAANPGFARSVADKALVDGNLDQYIAWLPSQEGHEEALVYAKSLVPADADGVANDEKEQ